MNIGTKVRNARKKKEISQETLASALGLTVQAISKWECQLSYPDISILPELAEELEVSLDYLLLDEVTEFQTPQRERMGLPDDDTLRIVQCIGNHILSRDEVSKESAVFIPLQMPQKHDSINVEIWGSANINGNLNGDVNIGGSLSCDTVNGDLNVGGSANCTHITGDVYAGGNVSHVMND